MQKVAKICKQNMIYTKILTKYIPDKQIENIPYNA